MSDKIKKSPPINIESQENKLISLAMKQAEIELEETRASSQIVTHFLKLGSLRYELELERAKLENKLIEAKIRHEDSATEIKDLYGSVLEALKSYTPPKDHEDFT